ncbi:MAG: phytanoyl-CoA dioxygenase family protein [Fimbriimonadia bacterium]
MQTVSIDPTAITQADVDLYRRQGYIRFGRILTDDELAAAREHVDWLMANLKEDEWPERMNGIHNEDEKMYALCTNPRLLDAVEKFIGPNIVLFSSHLLCKPEREGHAVPWHQDGIFWPLEPMDILTVWLAIDDAGPENGCMRVIPGTHTRGPIEHVPQDTGTQVLHLGLPMSEVDESKAVDIELKMGEFSMHEPWLIHGSNVNRSNKRRAGYTMRFMPATTKLTRTPGFYEKHKMYVVRGNPVPGINDYANV